MNMQPRLPRRAWEAATVILTAACIVLGILLGLTSSETKFQSGRAELVRSFSGTLRAVSYNSTEACVVPDGGTTLVCGAAYFSGGRHLATGVAAQVGVLEIRLGAQTWLILTPLR
jgi:hypothetical protein